ncbi:MAG: hypothetical protein V4689_11735 [Verrucomicrobiota bacterium]
MLAPLKQTNAELAARLRCGVRTVQKIRSLGLEPSNPVHVGEYLASIQSPSLEMLQANAAELQALEKQLSKNTQTTI